MKGIGINAKYLIFYPLAVHLYLSDLNHIYLKTVSLCAFNSSLE